MTKVTITPTDNGPYLVEGPVRVVDADGTAYDLSEQTAIFLCRWGGSGTKPFCDGPQAHLNSVYRFRGICALSAGTLRHGQRRLPCC